MSMLADRILEALIWPDSLAAGLAINDVREYVALAVRPKSAPSCDEFWTMVEVLDRLSIDKQSIKTVTEMSDLIDRESKSALATLAARRAGEDMPEKAREFLLALHRVLAADEFGFGGRRASARKFPYFAGFAEAA